MKKLLFLSFLVFVNVCFGGDDQAKTIYKLLNYEYVKGILQNNGIKGGMAQKFEKMCEGYRNDGSGSTLLFASIGNKAKIFLISCQREELKLSIYEDDYETKISEFIDYYQLSGRNEGGYYILFDFPRRLQELNVKKIYG